MPDFVLHPRLAADTLVVGEMPLCRVCLMNDARYRWLILVPRRTAAGDIDALCDADQAQLWREAATARAALHATGHAERINLGVLGNIVPQLHLHLVARHVGDAAWPGPAWGVGQAEPYTAAAGAQALASLRHALSLE